MFAKHFLHFTAYQSTSIAENRSPGPVDLVLPWWPNS